MSGVTLDVGGSASARGGSKKQKAKKEPFVTNTILEDLHDLDDITESVPAVPNNGNEATQKMPAATNN